MEFFQVDLLGTGGAERVRAPFCLCAAPLACTPSPSPCMQPFPLHTSLLVLPPPLARGPSPCAQPFPLHAALPIVCGIARAEGTRGALSLLCPPACRGERWVGRGGTGQAR